MSVVEPRSGQGARGQYLRSAATRENLIAAARKLFAEAGFSATGVQDIVDLASITRGALYHHFTDKTDLFEVVFVQVYQELYNATATAVSKMNDDYWRRLMMALPIHLRLRANSAEAQRILLVDGPAVLGWGRWRSLQAPTTEGMAYTLRMLMDTGTIAKRPAEPLANVIVAALNDAALAIANAPENKALLLDYTDAIVALVSGLRVSADR